MRKRVIVKSPSLSIDDTPVEIVQKIDVLKKKFKTLSQDFADEYNARVQKMQDEEQSIRQIENNVRVLESSLEIRIGEFEKEKMTFEKFKFDSLENIARKNKNIELQHKDINKNNTIIKEKTREMERVAKGLKELSIESKSINESAKRLQVSAENKLNDSFKSKDVSEDLRVKLIKMSDFNATKSDTLDKSIKKYDGLIFENEQLKEELQSDYLGIISSREKLKKDTESLEVSVKNCNDIEIRQASQEKALEDRKSSLDSKEKYLKTLRKEIDRLKR